METFITNPMLGGMQEMFKQLNFVITGAAQQAAIKMITEKVYSAVSGGGSGSGPSFITNWQTALETNPQKQAALFIESMSAMSTQMRGSSSYRSSEGVGGNYMSGLKNLIPGITSQSNLASRCAVTYAGNPANMFADGTFKNFSQFMSGTNNPWSYQTCMQNVYQEKLASLQRIAEVQAMANQGFIGKPGFPGILIKEMTANVQNMGNQAIASAQGLAQVITSAVMKMAMDAMQNGIGNVQEQIQKGATNPSDKLNTQTQNQVKNFGPGAMFGR